MTTYFRTLLLLGFTGLAASLSGCILETTSDGPSSSCVSRQVITAYWAIDNGPGTPTLDCLEAPASHVELVTNTGVYPVGNGCLFTEYSPGIFTDFYGRTDYGIPAGTTVLMGRLLANGSNALLSTAAGPTTATGAGIPVPQCGYLDVGFLFGLQ